MIATTEEKLSEQSQSREGGRALDWLNFWLADVQTGLGPFLSAALTSRGWDPSKIGFFLTIGGLLGVFLQAPAGAAVDAIRRKRTLIAAGIAAIVAASLLIAFGHNFATILSAQLLLGAVGPFMGPAVIAITLGLVGRKMFDKRLGRNASFNSAGNVFAALLMGLVGWKLGMNAIFFTVPLLAIPAFGALAAIPADRINYLEARGAVGGDGAKVSKLSVIAKDRVLIAFAASAFLFHFANAAMLPQLGELLTKGRTRDAAPFMAAAVTVTQVVVTLTAVQVGRLCARWGARPLLLFGFGVLPIRGLLYTLTSSIPLLIAIQVLDGIANSIFGVASAILVADRTRGSGRFNLAMGAFGTVIGIGASLSNVTAGAIAQHAGFRVSFLALAGIAALAFLCFALFVRDGQPLRT